MIFSKFSLKIISHKIKSSRWTYYATQTHVAHPSIFWPISFTYPSLAHYYPSNQTPSFSHFLFSCQTPIPFISLLLPTHQQCQTSGEESTPASSCHSTATTTTISTTINRATDPLANPIPNLSSTTVTATGYQRSTHMEEQHYNNK